MARLIGWTTLVLIGWAAPCRAGEEKVPLDKLPEAVLKAVKARFPGAELKAAEKEIEDGKPVYEVSIKDKRQAVEVSLTGEGTIVEIEKQIAADDLPEAVARALRTKYAGATYHTVEEVIKVKEGKEKLAYYEVLLTTAGKKRVEVAVTAEAKFVKEEAKSKEKDGR